MLAQLSPETLEAVVIGAISSLVASFLFLLILSCFRPKIGISDEIAVRRDTDGRLLFTVKIVNLSYFPIMNVKLDARFRHMEVVPGGGRIFVSDRVCFNNGESFEIRRYVPNFGPWKAEHENAYFAMRYGFAKEENLFEQWPDDSQTTLSVSVYGVHSLTNLGKVFHKEYSGKDCLKFGKFGFGRSMKITPPPQPNEFVVVDPRDNSEKKRK